MNSRALLLVAQAAAATVFTVSDRAPADFALTADPAQSHWRQAATTEISRDYLSNPIAGLPTIVRSRWTADSLYFLFTCPYDELTLNPNPTTSAETNQLWNYDVAEVFIGSDFEHIGRYKEFEVSPQGEWVDLDIDRETPSTQEGIRWNSGFQAKARIDSANRVWYAEMRIPFRAIDTRAPAPGSKFRLGLYRIAGRGTARKYYAWSPTGQTSFHVPQAFGELTLR